MSLINELINSGYLKTPEIIQAFREIKRRDFVRPEDKARAEINAPLSIGYGQTISQPATVAFMLEKLAPKAGEKILDVGCGSGWTTALLARIAGERGRVYGLERIKELRDFGAANLNKYFCQSRSPARPDCLKKEAVHIICSDGFYGLPEFKPFDKIMVSAAAEEAPPELLKQLKVGGRLVIPLGGKFEPQSIIVADKIADGEIKTKEYPGFVFVPLIKDGFK